MEHKIGWLNLPGYKPQTWNPVIGCEKKSEGCRHCYALRMAIRIAGMERKTGELDYRLTLMPDKDDKQNEWNGQAIYRKDHLFKALQWREPRMVFVCSMGDLFLESASFEWIDLVMATIAMNPKHLFLVLTKRPERMREYFAAGKEALVKRWEDANFNTLWYSDKDGDVESACAHLFNWCEANWPLPNLWLGVTAENQQQANKRIPVLLGTTAAKRFVSIEPMVGPVDLNDIALHNLYFKPLTGEVYNDGEIYEGPKLDWVICGGETGPNARPVHPDWVRQVRDQCENAGVPFFFKQWGEWVPSWGAGDFLVSKEGGISIGNHENPKAWKDKTHEPMARVGRKQAGNLIDGELWQEWPVEGKEQGTGSKETGKRDDKDLKDSEEVKDSFNN